MKEWSFNTRSILIVSSLFLGHALFVYAGNNAGAFLRPGIGARPLGMGGAFVSVCDDGTAVYWNPAGLFRVEDLELTSMYSDRFSLGVKDQYFSFAKRLEKGFSIGVGLIRTDVSDVPRSTLNKENGRVFISEYFKNSENSLFCAVCYRFKRILSLGLNLKYVYHLLDDKSGRGIGVDLGVLFEPIKYMRMGVNLQDLLDTKVRWNTGLSHTDSIPMNIKAGVSFHLPVSNLTAAFDVNKRKGKDPIWCLGIEIWPIRWIGVRAGFGQREKDDKPNRESWCAGGSIRAGCIQFDYAYDGTHTLGDTHRFSFNVSL